MFATAFRFTSIFRNAPFGIPDISTSERQRPKMFLHCNPFPSQSFFSNATDRNKEGSKERSKMKQKTHIFLEYHLSLPSVDGWRMETLSCDLYHSFFLPLEARFL
ncbi:hypothetical protein CDAR_14231 [Caerostris darwini]|uniref:Uncharacterized protein n=1 Tax=Caerostris darwini TaxID=1538125 RepID=A0AAV4QF69_9ARAC|nr:hypothetical protein CDAR_14231 [Caerostris darwini]